MPPTEPPTPTIPATPREPLLTPRFAMLLLAQTVFGFGWSLYLLTPKFLSVELGANAHVIGQVSAMVGVAGVLSVPFAASGIDRFGRVLFFRVGSLLIVVLSLLFLNVDHMGPLVYLAQGLVGAAFVLAFNGSATLVADTAPPDRLGHAIGILGAANMSMNAIAALVAEPLADRYGWDAVFKLGVLAGCAALVLSLFLHEPERKLSTHKQDGHTDADRAPARFIAALLLATLFIGAAFSALFIFYQPYALQLGAREVRGFFVGFTATAVLARVVFGNVGDRFGHLRVSLVATALYGLSAVAMVGLDPHRLWLYGAVFGIAHGVLYPTLNALILSSMSAQRRGRAMTFYNGAFNVGSASSALAWGWIAEHHGYPSVFWGAAVVSLLAVFTLARARRGRARLHEPLGPLQTDSPRSSMRPRS